MTRERFEDTRGGSPRLASEDEPRPLFGRNPVLELLRAGGRRVEEVAILAEGRGPALHELLGLAKRQGVKISYRTRDQLSAMAGDPHHQGVVARVAGASYAALADGITADTIIERVLTLVPAPRLEMAVEPTA